MGPTCPHCGTIYEWTCGELEEHCTAPKVYFCQECRGLFVLTPDEIEDLQARFRPIVEEASSEPADLGDFDPPPEDALPSLPGLTSGGDGPRAREAAGRWSPRDSASEVAPVDAAPLAPRERVEVVAGPHQGASGEVAVIAGDLVVVRVGHGVVRVLMVHVRRT